MIIGRSVKQNLPVVQALRRMERNGLIARNVITRSPIAVEYSITELGRTLQVPFGAMYQWSIDHLPLIEQARTAYDEQTHDRNLA